jgi:hypothetical protein
MKRSLQALVALSLTALSAPALAQDAQEPDRPQAVTKGASEKRWSVARDFTAAIPVGAIAADSGPMVGPLVRLGFQATPNLELGMRSGYLYGLDKEIAPGQVTALSSIPIVASARWFFAAGFFGSGVGPYAGIEAGANLLRRRYRTTAESALLSLDFDARESKWTGGSTASVGWVISRKVPIDLRAQVAAIDVFSGKGAFDAVAVGASAGWTIYF